MTATVVCHVTLYTLQYMNRNQEDNIKHIHEANSIDISIVVPAYNESKRLPIMLQETTGFMKKFSNARNVSYEVCRSIIYCLNILFYWYIQIIVVDDGSKDDTADVTRKLQTSIPNLRLMSLSHNVGKGGAVRSGVLVSRGKYILMV